MKKFITIALFLLLYHQPDWSAKESSNSSNSECFSLVKCLLKTWNREKNLPKFLKIVVFFLTILASTCYSIATKSSQTQRPISRPLCLVHLQADDTLDFLKEKESLSNTIGACCQKSDTRIRFYFISLLGTSWVIQMKSFLAKQRRREIVNCFSSYVLVKL